MSLFLTPWQQYFCGSVVLCQSIGVPCKVVTLAGMCVSKSGYSAGPASSNSTDTSLSSDNRDATTAPEDPPPT